MQKMKKLETILGENKWEYSSAESAYSFPDSHFVVGAKALHDRVGKAIPEINCFGWPASFFEEIKQEDVVYKIKLKDFHIVTMMADYKFTGESLIIVKGGREWTFPLSFLINFGNKVEVRKNQKDELVEVNSGVIIPTLLIESALNSRKEILDFVHEIFAAV